MAYLQKLKGNLEKILFSPISVGFMAENGQNLKKEKFSSKLSKEIKTKPKTDPRSIWDRLLFTTLVIIIGEISMEELEIINPE